MYKSLTIDGSGDELEVNWKAERLEWRYVLDSFKSKFADCAEFDGDTKSWHLPRSQHRALRIWASHHFDPGQIRDRTVHEQPRPQPPQRSALEQAYRTLHLVDGAPLWAAESVYRSAVKLLHPDVGGNHADAVAINTAIELLRRVAS